MPKILCKIIENSGPYDADTIRIDADGAVYAAKAADKTFNAPEGGEYFVGWIEEILKAGEIP